MVETPPAASAFRPSHARTRKTGIGMNERSGNCPLIGRELELYAEVAQFLQPQSPIPPDDSPNSSEPTASHLIHLITSVRGRIMIVSSSKAVGFGGK